MYAIRSYYDILDPHGATGYLAAEAYRQQHPGANILFLETAHPAKFLETVEPEIGVKIEIPERLAAFAQREKHSVKIGKEYPEFREYLKAL